MSSKTLLWGASRLFSLAQGVNRGMLRFTRKKADLPVVSIGNLIAGGAGKTPLAMHIAAKFHKSAILLRGYRSKLEDETTWVEDDIPSSVCGDEAKMMARKLTQTKIIVGKDRAKSAQLAKELGCRLIVLDDGWQQRHVKTDLSLVVLHSGCLLGKEKYLPLGLLRESPRRLRHADAIFVNYTNDEEELLAYQKKIRRWTNAPLIGMRPKYLPDVLRSIEGKKVGVFCAIGRPERFVQAVKERADVQGEYLLNDHDFFDEEKLRDLKRGAEMLVCTEKDFVKLTPEIIEELNIVLLTMEIELTAGIGAYIKVSLHIAILVREYEAVC